MDDQPIPEHPVLQRFRQCVPHLIESGLFSKLELSTLPTRVTGRLTAASVWGRFRDPDERGLPPGAAAPRVDFDALGATIGTVLLPYIPDADPEVDTDWREAGLEYLQDMKLLLLWRDDGTDREAIWARYGSDIKAGNIRPPTDEEADATTFHDLETLYEAD